MRNADLLFNGQRLFETLKSRIKYVYRGKSSGLTMQEWEDFNNTYSNALHETITSLSRRSLWMFSQALAEDWKKMGELCFKDHIFMIFKVFVYSFLPSLEDFSLNFFQLKLQRMYLRKERTSSTSGFFRYKDTIKCIYYLFIEWERKEKRASWVT